MKQKKTLRQKHCEAITQNTFKTLWKDYKIIKKEYKLLEIR